MKVMASIFLLIGLVAFGLGIYMFIDKELLNQLEPTVRLVFSILLILYGGFRILTAIGGLRKKSTPTAAK
jgi:hypothetical protein